MGLRNRTVMRLVIMYVFTTMMVALYGVSHSGLSQYSVFELANLVGPTVRSFLESGLMEAMPGYYGARMPIATLYAAFGYVVFGDRVLYIILLKVLLVIAVLAWVAWLVFRSRREEGAKLELFALLSVSTSSYTVANIINIQVEEAFGFSALAVCWAVLLYRGSYAKTGWRKKCVSPHYATTILFAFSAAIALLCKSSFVLGVAVLIAAYGYQFGLRKFLTCSAIVAAFGLAWASYQYIGSGRFTLGTSLDGWNLYKGNNPYFLDRYPPVPGTSLDMYDSELFKNSPSGGEWAVNDYYRGQSFSYIANNPWEAASALYKKFIVCFFSVEKYGSTSSEGARKYYELGSMVLFRIFFWFSLIAAVVDAFNRRGASLGVFYILFVSSVLLPYLIGFAYTRHVSVLAFPSVLFVLSFLRQETASSRGAQN